jgi:cytochrome c peroxidase
MKGTKLVTLVALLVLAGGGVVSAKQDEPSVEQGQALFNDTKLGTSGKSCNSCHPDGKGLEKAGMMKDLQATINNCIKMALQGKELGNESIEMKSLELYIKSLEKK